MASYKPSTPNGAENMSAVNHCLLVTRCRWIVLSTVLLTSSCTLFLLVSRVSAQTSQSDELNGAAEVKKGDYDNAIKLLNTRLSCDQGDNVAQRHLLRAYIETGRYTEAEASAKRL